MATQVGVCGAWAKGAVIMKDYQRELIVSVVSGFTAYLTWRLTTSLVRRHKLSQKRRKKQKYVMQALDELYLTAKRQITPEEVKAIVDLDVSELAQRLRDGRLKPIEALRAFQVQAIEVNQKTNCILEPILEADQWAIELETSGVKGPLYGIPISVKENLPLQGYDCAQGCSAQLGRPYTEDCVMVKVLKHQGAVPFMRTNMPQIGCSLESSQPIGGRTLHPLDPSRGPGGSSSGEAVMLAARGSPLGFGSDTGGSIRCPAALCGVTSMKPTLRRVSLKGRSDFTGNNVVMSSTSPIARDVDDVALLMKAVIGPQLWQLDFDVAPIPFNNEVYESQEPLKIGYFTDNGVFRAVPSVLRAMAETRMALQSLGHQVVAWEPPDIGEGFFMNIVSMCADGGKSMCSRVEDDVKDEAVKNAWNVYFLPLWIRRLASWVLKPLDPMLSRQITVLNGVGSCADWWAFNIEVAAYKHRVADSWTAAGLDAVICPAFAFPAMPIGSSYEMLFGASYVMPFNVLDYACGVVPVTKVTSEDQQKLLDEYPTSNQVYRNVKKGMTGAEGLPVAVQVVARTWRDETCLRVMKDIETCIRQK